MFVNGLLSGGETRFTEYTVYVSPYVVINGGGQLSKHIYMGNQRIVSKLCSAGSSSVDPRLLPKAAASRVDYSDKRALLLSSLRSRYDSLKVSCPEIGAPDPDFWVNTAVGNESDQYFYHSDHLGSSSLITNLAGIMVQHLEYVPFGEVFLDERISSWATPYKFNAKELDEETGLYYYGARYYDPRTSLWLSVDPLAEKYPNVSPYVYCVNNPVKYVDPDGRDWTENKGSIEWMDNVTSADKTPKGYKYVGSQDADILKVLGVNYSFTEQSSNRIGYVAADVEMGRYAVNHLINVKAKSNVSISVDVSYSILSGTENNRLGKKFEGIEVSATVIGYNSGADGTVNAYSSLTVDYGGNSYTVGMGEPKLPYLKQSGTNIAVGSVSIPASSLSHSSSFSGVHISGGWWITNSANMRTPVIYHPLTPLPQTFKHSWAFPNK